MCRNLLEDVPGDVLFWQQKNLSVNELFWQREYLSGNELFWQQKIYPRKVIFASSLMRPGMSYKQEIL